jgi:hypothetical protein
MIEEIVFGDSLLKINDNVKTIIINNHIIYFETYINYIIPIRVFGDFVSNAFIK